MKKFSRREVRVSQIREMFQCRNCITTRLDDRACLAFVISNMLRIDSQSILRLIARLNPPRSRQRPFLEYLYAINNSSAGELVANYVNGLDRRVTSHAYEHDIFHTNSNLLLDVTNLLCLLGSRNCRNI